MLAYAEETLILYLGLAFPIKCQIKFVKSSIILASPFLVWVLFNISCMLINQFVPQLFASVLLLASISEACYITFATLPMTKCLDQSELVNVGAQIDSCLY